MKLDTEKRLSQIELTLARLEPMLTQLAETTAVSDTSEEPRPGSPNGMLLNRDWTECAPRLSALGHPLRLQILQILLNGRLTVSELAAEIGAGTLGQVYHHLKGLTSAGWLVTVERGGYAIPESQQVPLLSILASVMPLIALENTFSEI